MATQSVNKNRSGIQPLGLIVVVTPGTPVQITSLIDPTKVNAPETANPNTSGVYTGGDEYTQPRAYQIRFQACKAAAHGLANNTGNIYILLKGIQGAGNRDDYGVMVTCLTQGPTTGPYPVFDLTAAALNLDVFSPYAFFIDADTAGDSCLVTLSIQ